MDGLPNRRLQRCSDVGNHSDTGAISSDIVLQVPTMVLVLKMLYHRSAHLSVCTVQLFMRKCVYEDMVIV